MARRAQPHLRQQARSRRRQLREARASFRIADTVEEAVKRLEDFERLHEARWRHRGSSGVLSQDVLAMLRDAAAALTPSGRFRLVLIEDEDRVTSAHVFVAACGPRRRTGWVASMRSGRRRCRQRKRTSLQSSMDWRWEDRLDLGPGAQHYKPRLASDEEQLT